MRRDLQSGTTLFTSPDSDLCPACLLTDIGLVLLWKHGSMEERWETDFTIVKNVILYHWMQFESLGVLNDFIAYLGKCRQVGTLERPAS